MADGERTIGRVRERFQDAIVDEGSFRDQHWVRLRAEKLIEVCTWLRDDPDLDYNFLADVTAVHWPDHKPSLEIVYHLYSYSQNDRLRIKVQVEDGSAVPSLTGLWKSADWNEREAFDMFGVEFEGHPDLRRILMPDDYTDHPLRKELPLYRG